MCVFVQLKILLQNHWDSLLKYIPLSFKQSRSKYITETQYKIHIENYFTNSQKAVLAHKDMKIHQRYLKESSATTWQSAKQYIFNSVNAPHYYL